MLHLAQEFCQQGLEVDLVLATARSLRKSRISPEVAVVELKPSSTSSLWDGHPAEGTRLYDT
ncbi:MAG: hypothetical protein WCB96_11710, partial [Candidatus Aminicenantales bacterium]